MNANENWEPTEKYPDYVIAIAPPSLQVFCLNGCSCFSLIQTKWLRFLSTQLYPILEQQIFSAKNFIATLKLSISLQ